MNKIIEVKNISKIFNHTKAIDGLNFSINQGEIFGFLGPSGSGKTTTINILTGQLLPETGEALVLGKKPQFLTPEELAEIGLVTDNSGFYEKLTLYQNVLFYSKFYGVSKEAVDDLLKMVGLYDSRKTIAEKLSTGMRQRMHLTRALINQPKIIFLDEPTSGLDPATSRAIHSLILDLKAKGTTIFLTTHDMHEATLLCDNLALLNKGKLVEQGNPYDLIQKYNVNKAVKIIYQDGQTTVVPFTELTKITKVDEISSLHSCEPSLEDIFIELTGGKLNV
ncbi:ABC transporter ATP-binding protein [Streptococcus sp. H31]|uniref:ABC transporter ATP-binding protein n=1 Tax=Streptococcus huangxiaojuni TaxID=3237239 RepID=UPI0034A50B0A